MPIPPTRFPFDAGDGEHRELMLFVATEPKEPPTGRRKAAPKVKLMSSDESAHFSAAYSAQKGRATGGVAGPPQGTSPYPVLS